MREWCTPSFLESLGVTYHGVWLENSCGSVCRCRRALPRAIRSTREKTTGEPGMVRLRVQPAFTVSTSAFFCHLYVALASTSFHRLSKAGLAPSQAPVAANTEPATGIRQSPRLNRKRPGGVTRSRDKSPDVHASVSGGKRSAALARSSSTAPAVSQPRKRRQVVARSGVARAPAGVLVAETPQKGRGKGARTSGLGDGTSRAPLEKPAVGPASPAGAMTRRRAMDSVSPEGISLGGARGVPSPPSWRAASSAAGRLFVAESPCASLGSARSRRSMLAAGDLCGQGAGISRQLAAESASPVRHLRSVVPDTPA